MALVKQTVTFLFLLILPCCVNAYNFDLNKNTYSLDVYNQKLKIDSTSIARLIDSARYTFEKRQYLQTLIYAEKAYEYLKKYPLEDYSVESILLLARTYRHLHSQSGRETDFNNTLKYYLKAITFLESAKSKLLLPRIYKEYGEFYATLSLPKLTIENYEKALEIIFESDDLTLKEELLIEIADLQYKTNNLAPSIIRYKQLSELYREKPDHQAYIRILKKLSALYREAQDYDNSLMCAKEVLMHYQDRKELDEQIIWYNIIGEISFEAGNNYQAKNAFVEYFELVNKDSVILDQEINSLRYVKTLISVGEIYKCSTDNGYLSDYELAIRHFNRAYDLAQPEKNPEVGSVVLNRIGKIYFNKGDFKTCITYFELALFYAKSHGDLNLTSDNYIMLARAYDAVDRWKQAAKCYELNAAYKDSLMIHQEQQRRAANQMIISQRSDNLRVEETLDRIEARERQELTLAEKELRNVTLERELEIYKRDIELKEALIANQKLVEDSVIRNLALTVQQIENIRNQQKIESLRSQQEIQAQRLKNQEVDRENKRQQIKILEQENSLAKSRQAYYVLSIVLISMILIFIIVVYIQKRRANHILRNQNKKIEQQSEKLKQAYQNLELLSTIGRDITASLFIEQIIETIYANINALMDASVLGIGVYDEPNNELVFPGVIERNERLKNIHINLDRESTLAAWSFLNQKEIIIDNYYEEYTNFIQPVEKPYPGDGNSTSIIYLPLTIGSRKLGVLTVQSFSQKAFNDYHINIVRNIAIYTKIALENANFYKQLEQKSKSLIQANKNIKEKNELIEKQNQQLLSINEEKNNLMRILAHDLRNPLSTAMSMVELVRFEKENLSAEQYQASEIIWRGLNRMNEMIRKILDVKAAESQKILLDWDQVNVNETLASLEESFRINASHKKIKMIINTEIEEPYIKVDRNYFNQIIENLVSNAIKFSPGNSRVYLNVCEADDMIRIVVKDQGPGIPPAEMSQLFKKFHKLSTKPTNGEESIGLGLSIVKKYVEVMNGKVWCESQVGVGTSFFIEFKREVISVS